MRLEQPHHRAPRSLVVLFKFTTLVTIIMPVALTLFSNPSGYSEANIGAGPLVLSLFFLVTPVLALFTIILGIGIAIGERSERGGTFWLAIGGCLTSILVLAYLSLPLLVLAH